MPDHAEPAPPRRRKTDWAPRAEGRDQVHLRAEGRDRLRHAAPCPALGESAALLPEAARFLLEHNPLPTLIFGVREGRLLGISPSAAELLDCPAHDLLGRFFDELDCLATGAGIADLRRLLASGETFAEREWRLRRGDGRLIDVVAFGRVAADEPEALAVVQLLDGRSGRWRDAQSRFREDIQNIFLHSPQPLAITDARGERYLYVNEAWRALYGHSLASARARGAAELGIWADEGERLRLARVIEENGACDNAETVHRHADGSSMNVLLSARLHRLDGEEVAVWQIMDVSVKKRFEQAIRRLNSELENRVADRTGELRVANEELEAFSYSVAHDLRAPLRAIDGYARLLTEEHGAALAGGSADYLERIHGNVARMARLIDDLLAFARVGRRGLSAARVDMGTLAVEVSDALSRDYPRTAVSITRLPAAWGDAAMLRQVLENLISNALKFSAAQPAPAVTVSSTPAENGQVFFVADNGVGFDMRHAGKLFGVFERLHGEGEYPGTGVGLAIVQRIVQRHKGRVWAESAPGQGATFYFELPDGPESLDDSAQAGST
jgi:PAS domain S-box-containing protein